MVYKGGELLPALLALLQNFYQCEVWQLLANTGLVARIVLLLLAGFSVLSWAIIASRIASDIWSAILSGCPSVTDSEVNK
jgi:hypothetical protein